MKLERLMDITNLLPNFLRKTINKPRRAAFVLFGLVLAQSALIYGYFKLHSEQEKTIEQRLQLLNEMKMFSDQRASFFKEQLDVLATEMERQKSKSNEHDTKDPLRIEEYKRLLTKATNDRDYYKQQLKALIRDSVISDYLQFKYGVSEEEWESMTREWTTEGGAWTPSDIDLYFAYTQKFGEIRKKYSFLKSVDNTIEFAKVLSTGAKVIFLFLVILILVVEALITLHVCKGHT